MTHRKQNSQELAAAKSDISERSSRRIDKTVVLVLPHARHARSAKNAF